jgi:hypothetical protein
MEDQAALGPHAAGLALGRVVPAHKRADTFALGAALAVTPAALDKTASNGEQAFRSRAKRDVVDIGGQPH